MPAAALPSARGIALILEHCARLNGLENVGPTAMARLRQSIGEELTRLLLSALVGDHRATVRMV